MSSSLNFRLVLKYRMIGMTWIHKGGQPPKVVTPLDGGNRKPPPLYGGKHSKNIQTYQQMHIEYVHRCIYRYLPYSFGIPIIPIIPYPSTSLPVGPIHLGLVGPVWAMGPPGGPAWGAKILKGLAGKAVGLRILRTGLRGFGPSAGEGVS